MSAGLISLVKGIALREANKNPLAIGEKHIYRPARTLIYLIYFCVTLGIAALSYAIVEYETPNFTPLLWLFVLFVVLGIALLLMFRQLTVQRIGKILIKKGLFRKENQLNLEMIIKVTDCKDKDDVIFHTHSNKMKISRYLIGFNLLMQENEIQNASKS